MNNFRKTAAWNKRSEANEMANQRPHPEHYSNSDEQKFRHNEVSDAKHAQTCKDLDPGDINGMSSYLMSFTKGMPHNFITGLLQNPQHFQYFLRAIDSGDPRDFRDTPLGPESIIGEATNCGIPAAEYWKSTKAKFGGKAWDEEEQKMTEGPVGVRAWESQSAGLAFELEGPDAQAVTMPPAPSLGSDELAGEMAEIYVQALTRDLPLNALSAGMKIEAFNQDNIQDFLNYTEELKKLPWFSNSVSLEETLFNKAAAIRRAKRINPNPGTAFRGITRGDEIGPYLSQFLLIGNGGINANDEERKPENGLISYGSISIDQRVRTAKVGVDYMKKWEEWYDVQQAANLGGLELYEDDQKRRFIHTGRDLATYVHYDALYEAYLNACLILLGNKAKFDPGIPFQENDNRDHQQGFAHFGGPHILSLVTEVATRALKAVRYQKYNIHRRCRPEVLAARITQAELLSEMAPDLWDMKKEIAKSQILERISEKNGDLYDNYHNTPEDGAPSNFLLPMAFCEGSPMHPAYGAGHATVAGACVTILKAFFDCQQAFKPNGQNSDKAFVSVRDGEALELIDVFDPSGSKAYLTVEGELNKLASNISIGRNWAGVHYFSDYYESLLMGEQIAIGILKEQKLMFGENFSMTLPLFGGGSMRI